jgi:hypothetical protein
MPLHDIHLEGHGTSAGYIASSINRGTCKYLLFIHELLFSFFGGASEHTCKSPVKSLHENLDQYNGLKNNVAKSSAVGDYDTRVEFFSVRNHSAEYALAERTNRGEFEGYHYLYSGLSPPAL